MFYKKSDNPHYRLKVYLEAWDLMHNVNETSLKNGLCNYIATVHARHNDDMFSESPTFMPELFPELKQQAKHGVGFNDDVLNPNRDLDAYLSLHVFWWTLDREGREQRLAALKRMIANVKKTIKRHKAKQ